MPITVDPDVVTSTAVVGTATACAISAFSPAGAGASVMTLVFGLQRFVSYGDLAVNKSDSHDAIVESMQWVHGDISLGAPFLPDDAIEVPCSAFVGCSWGLCTWPRVAGNADPNPDSHRNSTSNTSAADDGLMQSTMPPAPPTRCFSPATKLRAQLNLLFILSLVLASLTLVQFVAYCLWRRCMNRRYYARKRNPKRHLRRWCTQLQRRADYGGHRVLPKWCATHCPPPEPASSLSPRRSSSRACSG